MPRKWWNGNNLFCLHMVPPTGFLSPVPYLNAWTWEIKNKSCNNFARKTVFWDYAQQGGKSWGHKGTMSPAECIHSMSWWGAWDNSYKDHLTREHLVPSITLSPSRSWSPFCSCLHLSEWIAAFPFLSIYFPHCFYSSKNRVFPPEMLEKKKGGLSLQSMPGCSMGHGAGQN